MKALKVQTLAKINEHAIYTHTSNCVKQRDITECSARTGICLIIIIIIIIIVVLGYKWITVVFIHLSTISWNHKRFRIQSIYIYGKTKISISTRYVAVGCC